MGTVAMGKASRDWMNLSASQGVPIELLTSTPRYLASIDIEISVFAKKTTPDVSADDLEKHITETYHGHPFTHGEQFIFEFNKTIFVGNVLGLTAPELPGEQQYGAGWERDDVGLMTEKADVRFTRRKGEIFKIKASSKKYASPPPISLRLQKI